MKSEDKIFAGFGIDIFPTIPHFYWLGDAQHITHASDGKPIVFGEPAYRTADVDKLIKETCANVSVEEMIDAPIIGISIDDYGELKIQSGNQYLKRGKTKRFGPIWEWVDKRADLFQAVLWPNLIMFGYWCYYAERIQYTQLYDYFIGHDVFDRDQLKFVNSWAKYRYFKECGVEGCSELLKQTLSGGIDDVLGEIKYMNESDYGSSHIYGWRVRLEDITVDLMGKIIHQEFAGQVWIRPETRVRNALKGTKQK